MYTVELNDAELQLVRSAISAYVQHFGHDEADVLHDLKAVLARFPKPVSATTP
jgi:hypothetical protein